MLSGLPVIYGIKPFDTETTPSTQLGTIGVTSDGRKYRYARVGSGAALVAGDVIQSPAEDTGDQSIVMVAAAIGATEITTAAMTVTANQYANGYVIFTAEGGTGNGIMYRIKSHPAYTSAAATFQLYDPLKVAITASTQADFVLNPYDGVIDWPATQTGAPVGVAVVAAPASSYTWLQTGGVASVLTVGTVAVGTNVSAATGTAGSAETATAALPTIGYALTGIATAEFGAIYLIID